MFPYISVSEFPLVLQFKSGPPVPASISKPINPVAHNNLAYFRGYRSRVIYRYDSCTSSWLTLPECPVRDTSLVIFPTSDDSKTFDSEPTLHTVGGLLVQEGRDDTPLAGQIYCLRHQHSANGIVYFWVESPFPQMKEKRKQVTAVCYNNYLIAAGGRGANGPSRTVEVLNFTTKQWSIVAYLPRPVFRASGCISGGFLYVLGGCMYDERDNRIRLKYAYKVSISQLIESHGGDVGVFVAIKDLPLYRSATTTFCNRILAIGGSQHNEVAGEAKCSNLVYVYDQEDDVWKKVNHPLTQTRCCCFAVSFTHPKPQLMVVGGYICRPDEGCTDSVEIAEFGTPWCASDLESSSKSYESQERCEKVRVSETILFSLLI